jgi:hypothetical protein
MVCQLIILTLHGLLLYGANGYVADMKSFAPHYQLIYDSEFDTQYCVPTGDLARAMDTHSSE